MMIRNGYSPLSSNVDSSSASWTFDRIEKSTAGDTDDFAATDLFLIPSSWFRRSDETFPPRMSHNFGDRSEKADTVVDNGFDSNPRAIATKRKSGEFMMFRRVWPLFIVFL